MMWETPYRPVSLWPDMTVEVERALLRVFASKAKERRLIGWRNRRKWA